MITQKRLKEVISYNPETGDFFWIKTLSMRAVAGKKAGSVVNGYEATNYQNLGNMKRPVHNKSGIKGVYWDVSRKKWHAQIQIRGRSTSLGRFDKKEKAAKAYRVAAKNYFGQYARFE